MTNVHTCLLALAVTCGGAVGPAQAATQIGVSIGINAPGQYGRIDFNNYPQAVLVSPQAIYYEPQRVVVRQAPIYLYVPELHQSQWGRYCRNYQACGRPVYFVRDDWVREQYGREEDQRRHGKGPKHKDRHDQGRRGDKHRD